MYATTRQPSLLLVHPAGAVNGSRTRVGCIGSMAGDHAGHGVEYASRRAYRASGTMGPCSSVSFSSSTSLLRAPPQRSPYGCCGLRRRWDRISGGWRLRANRSLERRTNASVVRASSATPSRQSRRSKGCRATLAIPSVACQTPSIRDRRAHYDHRRLRDRPTLELFTIHLGITLLWWFGSGEMPSMPYGDDAKPEA